VVARRGRYLGGYLRTVAALTPNEANTEVTVTLGRSKATIGLMLGFAAVAIIVAVAELVPLTSHGLAGVWKWSTTAILLPLASFAVIFAANHWAAVADAEYLLAEISIALTQPPKNFWRTLAQETK
jgi:hypothetical protein